MKDVEKIKQELEDILDDEKQDTIKEETKNKKSLLKANEQIER